MTDPADHPGLNHLLRQPVKSVPPIEGIDHDAWLAASEREADSVRILAQRTIENHDSVTFGRTSESAVFAWVDYGGAELLKLAAASQNRETGAWTLNQEMTSTRNGVDAKRDSGKPTSGLIGSGFGHFLVGIVAHTPEISAIRATLANGTVIEDRVTDGVALLFLVFHDPGEWAEPLSYETVAADGRTLARDAIWIDPHNPPPG